MSNRVLASLALVVLIGGAVAFLYGSGFFDTAEEELGGGDGAAVEHQDGDGRSGATPRRDTGSDPVESDTTSGAETDVDDSPAAETEAVASVTGRAVAESGSPLGDVEVHLASSDGERLGGGRSAADGRFTVKLAAGRAGRLKLKGTEIASLPVDVPALREDQLLDLGDVVVKATTSIHVSVAGSAGGAIAGAEVKLMQNEALSDMSFDFVKLLRDIFKEDTALDVGSTGKEGTFSFEDVPAGEYVVLASSEGHQLLFSDSIKAAAGAAPPRVELRLTKGHVLTGKVIDEDDVGIRGAVVAVLPEPDGFPSVFKTIKQTTDAEGKFEFTRLGSGDHIVLVRADGYTAATDDSVDIDKGVPLVLQLSRGVTIAGRVFDQVTGTGLAGAEVFGIGNEGTMVETTSDAEGRFELTGVSNQHATSLLARVEGYSVLVNNPELRGFGPGGIEVDTKGVTGRILRDIPMTSGGIVEGRAFDSETGESLAGVKIRLMTPASFGGGTGRRHEGVTGDDGRYRIERVPIGGVMAVGFKRGYVADGDEKSMGIFGIGEENAMPKVLAGTATNIDVPMAKGATVKGLVVDPQGSPLSGATVKFFDRESGFGMMMMMGVGESEMAESLTGKDGRFELVGVPRSERVLVVATHPQYVGGAQQSIDARTPQTSDLRLQVAVGATLAGIVLGPDGSPARAMAFELTPENPLPGRSFWEGDSITATTDSEGRFEFPPVPPGVVTLSTEEDEVTIPGNALTHTLVDGRRKEVTIRLEPVLSIKGRVVDQFGEPVEGASITAGVPVTESGDSAVALDTGVMMAGSNLSNPQRANTNEQGEFTIARVSASTDYELHVQKWGPKGGEDGEKVEWVQVLETVVIKSVKGGTEGLVITVDYQK